jgi:hypothetical protein
MEIEILVVAPYLAEMITKERVMPLGPHLQVALTYPEAD